VAHAHRFAVHHDRERLGGVRVGLPLDDSTSDSTSGVACGGVGE